MRIGASARILYQVVQQIPTQANPKRDDVTLLVAESARTIMNISPTMLLTIIKVEPSMLLLRVLCVSESIATPSISQFFVGQRALHLSILSHGVALKLKVVESPSATSTRAFNKDRRVLLERYFDKAKAKRAKRVLALERSKGSARSVALGR